MTFKLSQWNPDCAGPWLGVAGCTGQTGCLGWSCAGCGRRLTATASITTRTTPLPQSKQRWHAFWTALMQHTNRVAMRLARGGPRGVRFMKRPDRIASCPPLSLTSVRIGGEAHQCHSGPGHLCPLCPTANTDGLSHPFWDWQAPPPITGFVLQALWARQEVGEGLPNWSQSPWGPQGAPI